MNAVLLLFSFGVFTFYTVSTSEHPQINEVETTSRAKPPQFVWDPEKRMWSETDDEDYTVTGYSGDGNYSSDDYSFLNNADNETDLIEEDNAEDEVFTFRSTTIQGATTKTTPVLPTISPHSAKEHLVGNISVDPLVKYEEKVSTNIESPLSLEINPSTVTKNDGTEDQKSEESHANAMVEVNPATENPLWPLEFEPKRTRPLQEELFISPNTKKPIIDDSLKKTTLEVIPLKDTETPNIAPTNSNNSNMVRDSPIINSQPLAKNHVLNPAVTQANTTPKSDINSSFKNINHGVDIVFPEYVNSKQIANETIIWIPVKTQIPLQHSIQLESNSEEKTSIVNIKLLQPTTIKTPPETVPEPILPKSPLVLSNNTNKQKEELNNKEPVTHNGTSVPLKANEEDGITTLSTRGSNKSNITSAVVNGMLTSSPSPTIKIFDTGINDIPNLSNSLASCVSTVTTFGTTVLHWAETPYNVTTTPQEICLKEDGAPVTRTCLNGVWSDVNETCLNIEPPIRTLVLNNLLTSSISDASISITLKQITTDNTNITSYEIHLVSKLLQKVAKSQEATNIDNVVKTVSNIMHYEPVQLRSAQDTLNSTDKILDSLDACLLKVESGGKGYRSIVSERLLVQEADLQKTDFSGFKVASSDSIKGFQPNDVSVLNQTTRILDGSKSDLELALIIPEELKKAIRQCNGSKANPNIIATVFNDDTLFNNNETQGRSEGKVVSVMLPGFNCSFTTPLKIIFKPPKNSSFEQKCAYWKYGFNKDSENIKGQWIVENKSQPYLNTTFQLCEFSHVTHFSLLVLGDLAVSISEADQKALNVITAVGSGLSLLGLFAVLLTAIIFKSYRSANGVVIHFSVAMAAQIILLFMADHMSEDKIMCTIFGAALHYVVLSQFCWMLTIALLQYKRYVLVFSNPTKYLMAKACAFAWGLPLVPIIVLLSISTDNYSRNSYGLCYAVKNYFIFGVLIPVALIVFINLLVFLRIMFYIASRKIKAHRKMDNATSLQLRLAIMLYFLLGLTWGFGLITAIGGGVIYAYLFCITATLQGFVLFLFFIALSDKTKSLWGSTLLCPCLDERKKYEVHTDSSSHPMVRRPTSTNTSDTFTDGTGNEVFHKYKNRNSMDF